eukprot:SM000173S03015  [mRNA]  locus=s173:89105:91885:- [translate_table: standard]
MARRPSPCYAGRRPASSAGRATDGGGGWHLQARGGPAPRPGRRHGAVPAAREPVETDEACCTNHHRGQGSGLLGAPNGVAPLSLIAVLGRAASSEPRARRALWCRPAKTSGPASCSSCVVPPVAEAATEGRNVLLEQYVGAEEHRLMESEVEQARLQATSVAEQQSRAEAAREAALQQKDAAAKEVLELRTRAVVQQQDMRRRDEDAQDLVQKLQAAVRERDQLRSQKDNLAEQSERYAQILERQATVIGQLMEQSEDNVKERDDAVQTLRQVDEDNRTLLFNVGKHSQVIEKLIEVNAEMMEAANRYSSQLQLHRSLHQQPEEVEAATAGDESDAELKKSVEDGSLLASLPEFQDNSWRSSGVLQKALGANDEQLQTISGHKSEGRQPWSPVKSTLPDMHPALPDLRLQEVALEGAQVKPKDPPTLEPEGQEDHIERPSRRPTVWTSDMLPLANRGAVQAEASLARLPAAAAEADDEPVPVSAGRQYLLILPLTPEVAASHMDCLGTFEAGPEGC